MIILRRLIDPFFFLLYVNPATPVYGDKPRSKLDDDEADIFMLACTLFNEQNKDLSSWARLFERQVKLTTG